MLEAWEKAEKIWYQYIWEESREPSNIVEYNINKEITKDASNVINANNDTTTWMATLVYGVNAPKLLEKTSIYNKTVIQWSSTLTFTHELERPEDPAQRIREATIVKDYGNITFENRKMWSLVNWVVIPITWTYQLEITYPAGSNSNTISTRIRLVQWKVSKDINIASYTNNSVYPHTETIKYFFNAWDAIYVYDVWEYTGSGSWPITRTLTTQIVITLL